MLERLFSLDWRRRRLLKRTPAGPLRDYLAVPFPAPATPCARVPFVALDLETTGLDPARDEILSVGLVSLRGTHIDLGSARHRVVRVEGAIPEASAVIHRITDDASAEGEPLAQVMDGLLPLLAGKVLIAHHARVEVLFLARACERLYGARWLVPVVDTQWLAQRTLDRRGQHYRPGELRLGALRERYNLPRYGAHNALSDALAAAELFIAQVAEDAGGTRRPLRDCLCRRY